MSTSLELVNSIEAILDKHLPASDQVLMSRKKIRGDKSVPESVQLDYHYRTSIGFSFIASFEYHQEKFQTKVPFLKLEVALARIPKRGTQRVLEQLLQWNRSSNKGERISLIDSDIIAWVWHQRVDTIDVGQLKILVDEFLTNAEAVYRQLSAICGLSRFFEPSNPIEPEVHEDDLLIESGNTNVIEFRGRKRGTDKR